MCRQLGAFSAFNLLSLLVFFFLLFFQSHTQFNHISDEIISSTFLVRKEPACDSVDQCFLPLLKYWVYYH